MPNEIRACPGLDELVAKKALGCHRGALNTWWLGENFMWVDQGVPHWSSSPGTALGLVIEQNRLEGNAFSLISDGAGMYACPRSGKINFVPSPQDGERIRFVCEIPMALWYSTPALAITAGVLAAHGVSREEMEEACRG